MDCGAAGSLFCHGGSDDRRKYLLSKRLNSKIFHARKVEYHEIKNAILSAFSTFFPPKKVKTCRIFTQKGLTSWYL